MSWTTRSDRVACCADPPGYVRDDEAVARILTTKNVEPDIEHFMRDDLLPPKKGEVSNVCGESHGLSVARCSSLSDDDLKRRSEARAAAKPGRSPKGAVVAIAQDLRAIRLEDDPARQIVYVYDDPMIGDDCHAVVRLDNTVPRTDVDRLRTLVKASFKREVKP